MKKKLLILFAALSTLFQFEAKADAWNVNRNSCWGFLSYRFHAYAKTSVVSYTQYQTGYDCVGRWIGKQRFANWNTLCNNNSKGCSRPRTATCGPNSGSVYDRLWSGCYLLLNGPHPYYAYARAQNLTSGWILTTNASGRGSAGQTGEYIVNDSIFDSLDDSGFSYVDISGDSISVENDNTLRATNINGTISIGNSTDYYSTFKIIVIKEKTDWKKDEEAFQDSLLSAGVFNDIVYSAEINVSKNNIELTGVFTDNNAISIFEEDDSIGVRIKNLSIENELGIQLAENETLTVITYTDGGFDISSAIIQPVPIVAKLELEDKEVISVNIYPNPSSDFINVELNNQTDNAKAEINIIDITGKHIAQVYNGVLVQGYNNINNIDIANVPTGLYIIQVKTQNQTTYHKFSKK